MAEIQVRVCRTACRAAQLTSESQTPSPNRGSPQPEHAGRSIILDLGVGRVLSATTQGKDIHISPPTYPPRHSRHASRQGPALRHMPGALCLRERRVPVRAAVDG
ncbi:hypothetical protein FIBSPDRAFT_865288 [Athelia psychrophila]|uniref:Uncharacterized protein n=1 Tax=Athelia psychrophila TaxID=1759441 RepID=A0A166FT64_9AGAM|nr:hypothetical protein FIBSPDRAFT_865288 [Fibularhizoctonia sp. CBS 109695]